MTERPRWFHLCLVGIGAWNAARWCRARGESPPGRGRHYHSGGRSVWLPRCDDRQPGCRAASVRARSAIPIPPRRMLVTSYSCNIKTHTTSSLKIKTVERLQRTGEERENVKEEGGKKRLPAITVQCERSIHLRRKTRWIRADRACKTVPSMFVVAGMQQEASAFICLGGDEERFRGCGEDCRMVAFYTLCRWVTSAEIISQGQSSLGERRREFKLDLDGK